MSWELRDVIIFDYITSLRPFGEKIEDFFLMSLDICLVTATALHAISEVFPRKEHFYGNY